MADALTKPSNWLHGYNIWVKDALKQYFVFFFRRSAL